MKRFLCALLILCLLPVLAFAESPDFMFVFYNIMAEEFGRETIGEEYETTLNDDGSERRDYSISDTVKINFYSFSDKVFQISVVSTSDDSDPVFLSACINSASVLMQDYSSEAISTIKYKLLMINEGKETDISIVDGFYFYMTKYGPLKMFFVESAELFREFKKNAP